MKVNNTHGNQPWLCVSVQVDADDVLTKEEQIYLLFNAKRKCERVIKSKHKITGKFKCSIIKKNDSMQSNKLLISGELSVSLHKQPCLWALSSLSPQFSIAEMTSLMNVGVVDTCVSIGMCAEVRSQVLNYDSALRLIQSDWCWNELALIRLDLSATLHQSVLKPREFISFYFTGLTSCYLSH